MAVYRDGFADGFDVGEQAFLDVGPHHGHGRPAAALFFREESPQVHVHLAATGIGLLDAHQVDVVHVVALVAHVENLLRAEKHRRNVRYRGTPRLDIHRVLPGQILARALLRTQAMRTRSYREFEDDDRIGAKAAQHARNRCVETRQDGAHADDRAGSDDDSQHREKRAQFVRANGLEGQHQSVDDRQSGHGLLLHPQRFDGIQARRAARRIDAEEQPYDAREPHAQEDGGPGKRHGHRSDVAHQHGHHPGDSTPARPPVAARHEDSTRNWFRMSRRRAPSDLRMPISWVRSVTTASMMFMITIPPTSMNTETIPTAMAAMAEVSRSQSVTKASEAKIEKLSSWPGPR